MTKHHIWKCRHCDTALTETFNLPQTETDIVFCCTGCETVFNILNQSGLDVYYTLKNNTPSLRPAKAVQTVNDSSWNYLDNPTFQADYILPNKQMRFYLNNIHCVACAWLLEQTPQLMPGISAIQVNIGQSTVTVKLSEDGLFSEFAKTVNRLGYPPFPIKRTEDTDERMKKENQTALIKIGLAGFCTGNIMLMSIAIYAGVTGFYYTLFQQLSFLLALPVILFAAQPFYKASLSAVKARQINIDVPVTVVLILGFTISTFNLWVFHGETYFDSLCTFVFLLLSTRYFLKSLHHQYDYHVMMFSALQPNTAQRHGQNSTPEEVPISHLNAGDIVSVNTNEIIPCDGTVVSATAECDTQLMTGEALPKLFRNGETLLSGYKNVGDPIQLKCSASGKATQLGQLIQLLNNHEKAKLVILADKIARLFLIGILVLSTLTFIFYLIKGNPETSLEQTLALIMIACPCALALATPLVYAMAAQELSKNGIILRRSDAIERLTEVTDVFFDKTGTLTVGRLSVIHWTDAAPTDLPIKAIVYEIEKENSHPVAIALKNYCQEKSDTAITVTQQKKLASGGIEAIYAAHTIKIQSDSTPDESADIIQKIEVLIDKKIVAKIKLSDQVKNDSIATISEIKALNITPHLLSGDPSIAADTTAKSCKIDSIYKGKSPKEKFDIITKNPYSLMVGDGANDAVALKASYVSLAVRGSLDISMKTADIIFADAELKMLPILIKYAKQIQKTVKLALLISLTYNTVGILFVFMGIITPLSAAIIMPLSSLTVLTVACFGSKLKQ